MDLIKESYQPKKIEQFVQKYWEKNNTFKTTEKKNKKKFYCLVMLPYPSGNLHMGHVRNYTIGDVIARYQRMLGKNVLHPMGWDAFGLPAEIAAIENKIHPEEWTKKNIEYMKEQLTKLGYSYDWSREINTSKPEYYKWEQWLFTMLYKKKLTYKKKSIVNWCPNDQTVLANEQVINNKCWRCNTLIEKKKIYQWFLKITKYANQLFNDLSLLKKWPEEVKKMQKNWIGKKEIIEITISLFNRNEKIKVYAKKLNSIVEATYIIISKNHWIAKTINNKNKENQINISKIDINKHAIKTKELAIHPITKKKIPIWIVNFLKENKNKEINAIICSPNNSLEEFNFKKKNYITIIQLIQNHKNNSTVLNKNKLSNLQESKKLSFKNNHSITLQELIKKKIIQTKTIFKIKDWGISRQRYWGTPIPMYKNKNGKIFSIPEQYLPIVLPKIKNINKKNEKKIIFSEKNRQFLINGEKVQIEKDTFDTFIESSWYYARYTSPNFKKGMFDLQAAQYWLPIDQYIGGIEHATMHLIYLRFFHKLLRDMGLVNSDEPVKNLLCQGMVLSNAFYYIKKDGIIKWIPKESIIIKKDKNKKIENYFLENGQKIINAGMTKMSKSKKNGIDPKIMIEKYGADTIRLFIMFAAPVEASLEWNESGVIGSYRFIKKLWKIVQNYKNKKNDCIDNISETKNNNYQEKIKQKVNLTIKKVTYDIHERKSFNTAISKMMKLVNELSKYKIKNQKEKSVFHQILLLIIKMMYPFIPHVCFVLWHSLTGKHNIDYASWPKKKFFEIKETISFKITIVIQINSKIRDKIKIKKEKVSEEKIIFLAKKSKKIKKYLKEKKIKKIIYIKNKLLNFVI